METGKPGLVNALLHINSVAAQTEKRMDVQAPLTTVYIHTVPALPAQPYPQPPAAAQEIATLRPAMPPLYSKETLPFLTLHITGGLQSQPGLSLAAAAAPQTVRPKSAGKHVCPHCGRDCMKPSVLEKHLRCHTGERPYPCTTCGVSFKTQSNLYKHKRTQAHARLSSESEQSSLGSLDSMSSSRETCTSSFSVDERSRGSGSMEEDVAPLAAETTCPAGARVNSVKTQGSVREQKDLTPAGHKMDASENAKVTIEEEKLPQTPGRHLPLQRQEATLFSKQWESSVSRGKSQSHESTDSGFSESGDHYPSPGCVLPEHSMDSLTESAKEHLEETTSTGASLDPGQGASAREQEQKTLEERISKLISENTAVVEDKKLENVRPRKTVLSKQGSIDLPMPYTYKDSFHFDMRLSKTPNVGMQRNRMPGLYSSVPTQHSSLDHAPLTRSNSLPFSVALLQPERSSPTSSYQSDYVTLVRRGSSGQINPTGFTLKPVNQQSSTHRPLVRQTAVDCNHATDGLFMNSSVEEVCTGSLSCDGDGGDICGEPSGRKFRRKKTQKFAYNKWYMYGGGGTFKKLYSPEKGGEDSGVKGRKCMTNPEHEVVQGLQKRLSAVQKETVTTATALTTSFTSSSVSVCHPGCPPAKLSLVDFNLKSNQLHAASSPLKAPLRRNLSLSVLPLPSIGSLVSHKADSMSRAEAARLNHEEKHTDSSSLPQIPSDRKKQKTDDKITRPLVMESDPNTLTHPAPSVAGSAPQQETHLTYTNLQKNQNHTHALQGPLFPPCIINAKTPSVSNSPASCAPSSAKTSFLPKYQLKLPNATEHESNAPVHVTDKPTESEKTEPSVSICVKKCIDPVAPPSLQSCDVRKTNAQGQLVLPCVTTALCHAAATLSTNAASSLAVVHRQFAATTITTTCRRDYQMGLCSASVQPSKPARGFAPAQLPVTPAVVSFPVVTAINNQTSGAITAFTQSQAHPTLPPSHTQPSTDHLSRVNRANPSATRAPFHVVPFDQMPQTAQNVFHVQTADLQICLQIISDEQLALIEPQIERQEGGTTSQRRDVEAPEANLSKSQEIRNEGRGESHQKESDQGVSLPSFDLERVKPTLSEQLGRAEANLHLKEYSDCTQVTLSAGSNPPETPGSLQRPHKHGHVNTGAETQSSDVRSAAPSLKSVKSGRSQTSEEEERGLPLNRCAEEQPLPDRRGGQGVLVCQQKPLMASPSPGTVSQNSIRGEMQSKESSRCKVQHLQVGLDCKTPNLKPQASDRVEYPSSDTPNSSRHTSVGCDGVGPVEESQEMTLSDSQDVISSAHSEKQMVQFTSASTDVQVDRAKDVLSVLTSIQSPAAGLMEGASLAGCLAQKETLSRGGTPKQGDVTDRRPEHSQESGETSKQQKDGPGGGGVAGEERDGGVRTDEEPGQRGKAESSCRYMGLQERAKPEGGDGKVTADSLTDSCGGRATLLFDSAQEMNNLSASHQHRKGGPSHAQQTQMGSRAESTETQDFPLQIEPSPSRNTTAGYDNTATTYTELKSGNPKSLQPGVDLSTSSQFVFASNSNITVPPSQPFPYPGLDGHHDAKDNKPDDDSGQSGTSARPDVTNNKYQTFFFTTPLHGYQTAECVSGGVRPVQSCQDYAEDTSSSDDEGKLIIEL